MTDNKTLTFILIFFLSLSNAFSNDIKDFLRSGKESTIKVIEVTYETLKDVSRELIDLHHKAYLEQKKLVQTQLKILKKTTKELNRVGEKFKNELNRVQKRVFREVSRTSKRLKSNIKIEIQNAEKSVENRLDDLKEQSKRLKKELKRQLNDVNDLVQNGVDNAQVLNKKRVDLHRKILKGSLKPITKNVKFMSKANDIIDRAMNIQLAISNTAIGTANIENVYKVDTYRSLYNDVKKESILTIREINRFKNKTLLKVSDKVLSKISSDLDEWMNDYVELDGKILNYADAATSFDSIVRVTATSLGSTFGGPLGAAVANVVVDRFVLKKSMTIGDIAKSMAIGMAAGYAGEAASGLSKSARIAHMSSQIAENMTRTLADAGVNHTELSERGLVKVLLVSVVNVNTGNNVLNGLANGASSNSVEQLVVTGNLDIEDVIDSSAKGAVYETINGSISEAVENEVPEEYKRLDKKLGGKILSFFEMVYHISESTNEIQDKMFEEILESLSNEDLKLVKEKIRNAANNLKDQLALKHFNKKFNELTLKDLNNLDFSNDLEKGINNLQEEFGNDNEIALIAKRAKESNPMLRAPASPILPGLLLVATGVSIYTSINEIQMILKMPEGPARNEKAVEFMATEAGYAAIGFLTAGAGSSVLKSLKALKSFKYGKKVVDSARKSLGSAADVTIGFTKGTGQFPFLDMRRAQHAVRHLSDAGVMPKWSKKTYEAFKKVGQKIVENPRKTFNHVLRDGNRVKGFHRKVDGKDVVIFIYKKGKDATKVATSIVPSAQQMTNWGLK